MSKPSLQKQSSELNDITLHLIETAYQDMEGVVNNRKGYRLRHDELNTKFKQQVKDLILGLIGENQETVKDEPDYQYWRGVNAMKTDIRRKVKEL